MNIRQAQFVPFWTALLAVASVIGSAAAAPTGAPPLRALLVGGGPDPDHNQIAIASNIRYVDHLLPPKSTRRILFTDGNPHSANVLYEDAHGNDAYQTPNLPALDGPSRLSAFDKTFQSLTDQGTEPIFLYFTGHGGPGDTGYDNNEYDMWDNDELSVQHLAARIDSLPTKTPVVLVMVECFSGGFGNLLFQGGDPLGKTIPQDFCGFFASVPSREAAGCTPEVNQANYHDFTSYFFAALSGQDRLGHKVTGADYNHDGVVGMNEAFAYAEIHDISIDTPTCTSDVFLRRFVSLPEKDVFSTSYADVLKWADSAQRAALEGLSQTLGYHEADRLLIAYEAVEQMTGDGGDDDDGHNAQIIRFARVARTVVLAHTLTTGSDTALKARYAALLAAEARNPLRGR